MASFHKLTVPDLLRAARDLYTNARDDAEIFAILSAEPYAFTAADFDAGLDLVRALTAAIGTAATEDLQAQQATRQYGASVHAVHTIYVRNRDQARKRFPRGTPEYSALHLAADIPDDREDLLRDATRFYSTLAERPDLVTAIRGITDATITDARALITAATADGITQTKESGDVEVANTARRDATDALRAHAAITASDCTHALADHPQLRERLGLLERS